MELASALLDEQVASLSRSPQIYADLALARRYAPVIRFDQREPFLPSAVGYTVFRKTANSLSFPRDVPVDDGIAFAIEYAIWWDWDIQHLYELEHIWVYVDGDGALAKAEASWHGRFHQMLDECGRLPRHDGRLMLCSEAGKHAFAPSPQWLLQRKAKTLASCGARAGAMAVHVTPLFESLIRDETPLNNRLVHTWLERQSFQPSFEFDREFDLRRAVFVPWPSLKQWIPPRVSGLLDELKRTIPPCERRVLRIAHRGASAYAAENSLAAIRASAELGADMVEIDIRATADDIPLVIHDGSLKRTHGISGEVSDFTLVELRAVTAASGPIVCFDEAVECCRELDMGLYLDIKRLTDGAFRAMFKSLDRHNYMKYTIFGSFRPDYLADIRAARPDAKTSILFGAVDIDPVKLAQSINADYVHPCWEKRADQPHTLLTPDWIAAVREANLGIVCWHEERPSEIAALMALGVDAICSDKPELLL
ncbi:MAG: glycerophosphodiester phosphodiesterase family protein [Chloroflexi bacterium]|nr:glycerophosphodiester phosphodiesterase family protein [Chloroflexota bacterium]